VNVVKKCKASSTFKLNKTHANTVMGDIYIGVTLVVCMSKCLSKMMCLHLQAELLLYKLTDTDEENLCQI